jgi:hypothetical protein
MRGGFINNNYEVPFCRFWVEGRQLERMREVGANVICNIDYAKFKLFHLSVLWRASVCLHPVFHRVSLGPHAERIRSMLLAHDPGPASQYPITAGVIINDDNGCICTEVVTSPLSLKVSGHRGYTFVFCGCRWVYFASSHRMQDVERIQLDERGRMTIEPTSLRKLFRDFYGGSQRMAQLHGTVDARRALASVPKK